jgi:hypothetical protein
MPFLTPVLSGFTRLRLWAQHHGGEVLWAAAFALVVGVPAAVYAAYFIADPLPYKIYLVAGSHYLNKSQDPSLDTAQQFIASFPKRRVADAVDVDLEVVPLAQDDPKTAESTAQELLAKGDALLVIGHLDSEPTEASLPIYLKARPQVPFIASVQTEDGLLDKTCPKEPNKRPEGLICYDQLKPLPYLQLSPTNLEQARWAVRFAAENHSHKFLIVENDAHNKPYAENLALDYSNAIAEYNKAIGERHKADKTPLSIEEVLTESPIFQMQTLTDEILWEQFKDADVDCVLYAGGFDGAGPLLKKIVDLKEDHLNEAIAQKDRNEKAVAEKPLMVLLDDSVVEERLSGAKFELSPVHITDQADAADYSKGVSAYGLDAIMIATQLIDDLNKRGFDWKFRVKKRLHLLTVEDARRNLVRVMQQNYDYHASYFGAARTAIAPESRTVYAFDGYLRANGMFHVWERVKSGAGYANIDVDRWHPLRDIPDISASGDNQSTPEMIAAIPDLWRPVVARTAKRKAPPARLAAKIEKQ